MSYRVDLNSDLGEGFGSYTMGMDSEILKYVSSANIACGYHAGDAITMRDTMANAIAEGVEPGAHPGLPDLQGFGRRVMNITPDEAYCYMMYQLGALGGYAQAKGVRLQHVKPHGALYNMAAKDYELSKAIAQAVYDYDKDLILMGLSNSELTRAGADIGLKVAGEVFADRSYNDDGTLVNRRLPGAVIKDKGIAIDRVVRMVKEGKVTSINGKDIDIKADSICVHGDNPSAIEFVRIIRERLTSEGVDICPLKEFI